MKVLHLIDSGGLYGAEKMLLTLVKEQIKSGHEPVILSCGELNEPEKPFEKEALAQGHRIKVWRMNSGIRIREMFFLWTWIHAEQFNVLHSHGFKFNVLLAITKFKGNGIPIISTIHGYMNRPFPQKLWLYELIDKFSVYFHQAIVSVNKSGSITPFFKFLYSKRLSHIPNGIEFNKAKRKLYLADSIRKILVVGRLSPEKGHFVMLSALNQLLEKDNDIQLVLAGDGDLKYELEKRVSLLGLENNVKFLGFVSSISSEYAEADAVVMPSSTEGLPMTLLEAIDHNLPVFATPVGGIPNILIDDNFIIAEQSAEAICRTLINWNHLNIENKKNAMRIVRDNAVNRYSASNMCKQYIELYGSFQTAEMER